MHHATVQNGIYIPGVLLATYVVTQVKDAHLPILGDIFFIILILWGSFFTLNLLLAVLEGNFTKGKENDKVRVCTAGSASLLGPNMLAGRVCCANLAATHVEAGPRGTEVFTSLRWCGSLLDTGKGSLAH